MCISPRAGCICCEADPGMEAQGQKTKEEYLKEIEELEEILAAEEEALKKIAGSQGSGE